MSAKVFISYSSVDEKLVKKLAKILDEMGIDYFFDRKDISWGSIITGEIRKALHDCSAVVVVISPASLKSTWVPFEIGLAVGAGKKILPFLTHPSLNVPIYLQDLHYKTNISDVKEYFKCMFDLSSRTEGNIKSTINESEIDYQEKITNLNSAGNENIPSEFPPRKPTGIKELDRILWGGITCGSVVTISANPRARAEVWLYTFAQVDKTFSFRDYYRDHDLQNGMYVDKAFYFTTEKSPIDVQNEMYSSGYSFKNISFIDINGISNKENKDILDLTEKYMEIISQEFQKGSTIIFDNFSFYLNLDVDSKRLKNFIYFIIKKTREINAVLYLSTLKQNNPFEDFLYSLSDCIFEIELEIQDKRILNIFSILKNKVGDQPSEKIRFRIGDGIQFDTTKEII